MTDNNDYDDGKTGISKQLRFKQPLIKAIEDSPSYTGNFSRWLRAAAVQRLKGEQDMQASERRCLKKAIEKLQTELNQIKAGINHD